VRRFLGFLSLEMTVFFLAFLTSGLVFSGVAFADSPSECIITIKSVELKKSSGEWLTVIEPDHRVDLVSQEPVVSFFNNGRRVPPANYKNFKITLLRTIKGKDLDQVDFTYDAPHGEIMIYGKTDFLKPLKVSTRSFVSVWFVLDLSDTMHTSDSSAVFVPPKNVKSATITVDDERIVIPSDDIRIDS